MAGAPDRFVAGLRSLLGDAAVLTDPELTARHRRDWTGRFLGDPDAVVVRPADAAGVAAVVERCAADGVAIVPQGGNTGLVGGSVPLAGELVLSTERLVGDVDVDGATGFAVAGAGTPLVDVQRAATGAGWRYGVDIASRATATIGGTVATNAGGLRVVRHGMTRAQVAGVAFVDGTGHRHDLGTPTLRDNTGPDVADLLCGSEGTLGVITAVRVRLVPELPCRSTALVRFATAADAAVAVEGLRGALPSLAAAEVFFGPGLELVCDAFGWPPPFATTAGGYVLVEVADTDDRTDTLGEVVASLAGVADVAVATPDDPAARDRLWRYRERHTEAIATVGVPHKLDVAVPPGALATFVARVTDVIGAVDPAARVWLFGHGGEATLHVNVTGPAADDDTVDDAVLDLVEKMRGSISAEHGIGTAKRARFARSRSATDAELWARVAAAFDPHGIMNPAVLA